MSDMQIAESTRRAVARILWPTHSSAVEDVLQSALLNVLKSSSHFEGRQGAQYKTWFHRVAINKALEHRRNNWRELAADTPTNPDGTEYITSFLEHQPDLRPNPEEQLLARERNQQLVKAILGLNPIMRQAILEFYVMGERKGSELFAGQLSNTKKARKWRALRELRERLGVAA